MTVTLNELLMLVGRLDDSAGFDTPRERFRRFLVEHVTGAHTARSLIAGLSPEVGGCEIYDGDTFERIVNFRGERGADWKSIADGYEVVVLETGTPESSHAPDFLTEPGATQLYADDRVTVIRRAPSP